MKDTPNRWDSINSRANRPVSPTTVRSYYTGLQALFTWAIREGLIEVNPIATVNKPKLPHRTVKGLQPEVMERLLKSINGHSTRQLRNKAILYVFLDTGLRLSELANLRLSDIDLKRGILKTIGKGNKERFARIGVKTQKALWNYMAQREGQSDHVWVNDSEGQLASSTIAQMIRHLGERNGILLSPHKLRHSFAISFLRNSANSFELQLASGHKTLEMTRRYTQALGFDDVFKRHVTASPVDRVQR